MFLGASTCAGPACHGRSEPSERARSQQTEFSTWSTKDKHRTAYEVLANDQSLEIARYLRLADAPQQSARCLNCHSMNVLDPARRGQDFRLTDGVSCDGCHGPAERWLGSHLNEPYGKSIKKGMVDIRNPLHRAEMCLSCHLGDRAAGKVVDHEMLAAGHPRLDFELNSFSDKMPAHWREKIEAASAYRAQLWMVGQLSALRAAARLLAADAADGSWPEYAHFDCVSCHHDLQPDSWRQRRGGKGSTGRPIWGAIPAALLVRQFANGAEMATPLDRLLQDFASSPFGKPEHVVESAVRLDEHLMNGIESVQHQSISREIARELAVRLCDAADKIAGQGPAAARQLVFALASLVALESRDAKINAELEGLESDLSDPDYSMPFDRAEFVRRVAAIRESLSRVK
jgi:hypothetical protein